MAKRSKFQAPRVLRDFESVQRSLREVQESLDAATISRAERKVNLRDFALVAGNFHRVSAGLNDIDARLPAASGENLADTIVLHLEGMQSAVRVWAAPGQTVNGLEFATFDTDGIVILWSNGVDAWSGIMQVPAESPAGEALDAEYVLGDAHASLPNGIVPSAEFQVPVAGVSSATWQFPVRLISELSADLGRFHSIRFHGGTHTTAASAIPGGAFGDDTAVVLYSVDVPSLLAAIDSTSIVVSSNTLQRAAVSGAVNIAQNANASLFAGIRTNSTLQTPRTRLHFIDTTTVGWTPSDDAGNDEWQERASVRANSITATHIDETGAFAWSGAHTFASTLGLIGAHSSALPNGNTNNLAIGSVNAALFTTTGAPVLTGMVPTFDGQMVWVENTDDTEAFTIAHDATSTAANRFYLPLGQDMPVTSRTGVWFRYNGTLQRWVVASGKGFTGISVRNSPTLHTAVGTIDMIAGDGLAVAVSSSSSGTLNEADITYDLADVSANQILCNASGSTGNPFTNRLTVNANAFPARVGSNLVSHPFSTLAGIALDYSAGVIDVDIEADGDIIVASGGGIAFRKDRSRMVWWEDFDFLNVTGSTVGAGGAWFHAMNTNWYAYPVDTSGNLATVAAANNHPGIWRLTSGTGTGDWCCIHTGTGGNFGTALNAIRADEIAIIEWIVRLPVVTNAVMSCGWVADDSFDNFILADFDSTVGTIRLRCTEGGVETTTDTGVGWTANQWNVLTIVQDTVGTIELYVDDVLGATNANSNVPDSETGGLFLWSYPRSGTPLNVDIDYCYFESDGLGARTS